MGTIIFLIVVMLIASIIQASTGFGFAIIATPFLLLILEPQDAIQLNLIASVALSSVLILKVKEHVDFGLLKRFLIGSIIGLPFGFIVFVTADVNKLKLGMSVIILTLTLLLIFRVRLKQTKVRDFIVGSLSGGLTSSVGMPGPPMLLYFSGAGTKKESVRATTTAFYLITSPFSIVVQWILVGTSTTVWVSTAVVIPIIALGLFGGQLLFKRMSQHAFKLVTYGLLLFTGVYLFIDSVGKM